MVTDVVVLLDFISRRDAEDCVAARRELKAFHFNGILKSKCLATQKNFRVFSCFSWFQKTQNPLRVSVLRKITLRVLQVAKARARATNLCAVILVKRRDTEGNYLRHKQSGVQTISCLHAQPQSYPLLFQECCSYKEGIWRIFR